MGKRGRPRKSNTVVVWQPDALPDEPPRRGKHTEFLECEAAMPNNPEKQDVKNTIDIVGLYGGKDCGKTELLLVNTLRPWKIKNSRWLGVVFRREWKELEEVIKRAKVLLEEKMRGAIKCQWYGSSENPHYLFESGARLEFHIVPHLGDEEKYQGWEITDLMFDQLEQFLEPMYDFLLRQNRSPDPENMKAVVRWTANPLGVGGGWLNKRYIRRYDPGTVNDIKGEWEGRVYTRRFKWIHMTVRDNPMARRDPSRIAALATIQDETQRRAYLEGDPTVSVGLFFDRFNGELRSKEHPNGEIIEPFEIPDDWTLTAGIDPNWGGGVFSGGLGAQDPMGNQYRICSHYAEKMTPQENADAFRHMIESCPFTHGRMPSIIAAGKDAFVKRDRYAILAHELTFADVFRTRGLYLTPAITDRHMGFGAWKALMPHHYFIFKDLNNQLVEQLLQTMADPKDKDDILGKGNDPDVPDHALDDERYRIMSTYRPVVKASPIIRPRIRRREALLIKPTSLARY